MYTYRHMRMYVYLPDKLALSRQPTQDCVHKQTARLFSQTNEDLYYVGPIKNIHNCHAMNTSPWLKICCD